ncbi:Nose resistant to fluoxetine protein 6 [Araneus ventricosus]|uniref:Nose resistant to fluoxetine protein 6 n=1 Tax=Araneus ventricosus TaxID=182803 RepID=A0A4Y2EHE5_ARAVE|nr:Nose resistant to fluoxetine protein 6 [Araneus ventricosus]
MYWTIKKIFISLVLNFYAFSVQCRNADDANSFQNCDVIKSIKKSAEDINISKNLKLISEEDKNFINAFQDFLPNAINPILLEFLSQAASDKCVQDLQYVFRNLLPPSDWSMKMVDSFGKPESGILLGNSKWLGEYDECLKIYAPPKGKTGLGDFHGKYCTLSIPLKLGNMALPISTAVCLPDSCNPNATFNGIFNRLPTNFNMTGMNEKVESILSNSTITCKPKSKELTTGAMIVITLLSIFALLAVIGSSITALEHYMRTKAVQEPSSATNSGEKSSLNGDVEIGSNDDALLLAANKEVKLPAWLEKCKPFFNCFCVFTNGEKILNTASAEGHLPCLHGIRFLSMAWVIICHGYMNGANSVRNSLEMIDFIDHWTLQVILNGFFSVDSFFVLSGFLVGYLYFQQAAKTDGKIPWLYFYIHRYVRLTPVYMIVLAFFATVSPFLGSGPLWPDYTVVQECKDNWWWNLLYINNFQNAGCMTWAWYLANDMQFYVISPLFLITLYRWPKIGYSLLGLFFCITFTANFAITYEYDLVPGMGNIVEYAQDLPPYLPRLVDIFNMIYVKPYTRVGAYLVGLLLAYIVYKRKQNNSGKLNTITLWIGWILASSIALACQFGLYHHKLSTVETSFYNALSRIGFSLALAWVIFVCVIGQGDAVNSILSWKALIPLSRLTYCAYLVHPIVQITYFGSIRRLIEFNHINVMMLYLGTLFISYAAALVISLLFESPVIRLERLLRNKFSS